MTTSEPGGAKRLQSQHGEVKDRWRKRAKDEHGNPIEVPSAVDGLPAEFRFHELRHYASLLTASALDVKVVEARLRRASGKTTFDTYGHLWPDRDDSSRAAFCGRLRRSTAGDKWGGASGPA